MYELVFNVHKIFLGRYTRNISDPYTVLLIPDPQR
jgi:hypothetical protein